MGNELFGQTCNLLFHNETILPTFSFKQTFFLPVKGLMILIDHIFNLKGVGIKIGSNRLLVLHFILLDLVLYS